MAENLFCSITDLKNEASVEACFINRLLSYLGYKDKDIAYKESISEIVVGKGSGKILYKPDYVLKTEGIPSIVIDAKSPKEDLLKWESQCSSYCLEINKQFDYNPVQYFILSNGVKTSLYQWDVKTSIVSLNFNEFLEGNPNFKQFTELLSRPATKATLESKKESLEESNFKFEKKSLSDLFKIFQKLHQEIWKIEKKNPSAAFEELIKIIFIKIQKDKQIHYRLGENAMPKYKDVVFSSHWINSQTESSSPINDILFKNLVNDLERDIQKGLKKRFFKIDEKINISPETIKKIVKELENIDLYGMEEDIHGRMFEAFLDATIRGKDIGQFFTPRDIVSLMVGLADIKVTKDHIDSVLDACCGSGGFLISALMEMLYKAKNLVGITDRETEALIEKIQTKSVFGIDAGSDPAMFKIARMNMYLHGDGGSNIFYADSLDKNLNRIGDVEIEVENQLEEVKKLILEDGKRFDVILSNPPFSMKYSRDNKEQSQILNQYDVSKDRVKGKIVNSLLSSVMFIERYLDLVSDRGKIIAIIDDSVLSGSSYSHIRNYLREMFIIEGIISLPGDAFKRASARVKTSILILRKKAHKNEVQKDIFLDSSIYLGLEEKTAKRIGLRNVDLELEKKKETVRLITKFKEYKNGTYNNSVYDFKNCSNRLDVKYCINDKGRKVNHWKKIDFNVKKLGDILKLAKGREEKVEEDKGYQLLVVNYGGDVVLGEILEGHNSSYNKLYKVRQWDLLFSNMGFGRGAISIVPPYLSGMYVSNEYTILNAGSEEQIVFYWNLLRTKEILADVLSSTTGMNRGRIKWEDLKSVLVPEYKDSPEIKKLAEEIKEYWKAYEIFTNRKKKYTNQVSAELQIDGKEALYRWLSFKPPE
jgi:type I restriction enzyme M protein